jgi:hypothetical protein
MGKKIVNALMSVVKNVVIFVVSIMTISFLICADVLALLVYPIWAWKNPWRAAESDSLVDVLNWQWLEDIVKPRGFAINLQVAFFQMLMYLLDIAVISLWNAWFLKFAPMTKRKYFINMLGSSLQSLSPKVQIKYFQAVESERKVYLIKNNMLSPEILPELYKLSAAPFVAAGKISDEQFRDLPYGHIVDFSEKYDLSLRKQYHLVFLVIKETAYISVLSKYILRKGLHPAAIAYFYECIEKKYGDRGVVGSLKSIPEALEARQDLVTVQQTMLKTVIELEQFASYLEGRKKLGYEAQVEMSADQYVVFHKKGLKMQPEAVHEKLARVNKNADATRFVELMMRYGEFTGDEVAMHQIAGDEKLSQLWLTKS